MDEISQPPPGTNDKSWQKNAPTQIVLDSIFAALAGVLIVFSVQDTSPGTWHKFLELAFSFSSFLLFARSAEGTTTALDEKDVRQYVYYLIWYNLAAILLVLAIWILTWTFFLQHFVSFLHPRLLFLSLPHLQWFLDVAYFTLFVPIVMGWIRDFFWIIFVGRKKFNGYLDELEDRVDPEPEPTCLFKLFYRYTKR